MFENYGIKDFYASIIKHWKILLAVLCIMSVAGGVYGYIRVANQKNNSTKNYEVVVLLFPKLDENLNKDIKTLNSGEVRTIADDYLKSDYFYRIMLKSLKNKYSDEQIKEMLKISSGTKDEELEMLVGEKLKKMIEPNPESNGITLQVKISGAGKEIIEVIKNEMLVNIVSVVEGFATNYKYVKIGETSGYVNSEGVSVKKTMLKYFLIAFVLTGFLECLILFSYYMLHPTVNRPSDLKALNLPFLGDAKKTRKGVNYDEQIGFIIDQIELLGQPENTKVYAITSSLNEEYAKEFAENIGKCQNLPAPTEIINGDGMSLEEWKELLEQQRNKDAITLLVVPPLYLKVDALKKARTCDGVIFAEKYSASRYENLNKNAAAAQKNEIKILGVIFQ